MSKVKKRSILFYWSIRYCLILFASMLIVGSTFLLIVYFVHDPQTISNFLTFSLPRMAGWVTLMICGWVIIYTMIRRLRKPLQEVSAAARQVVEGRYEISLDKSYKEREVDELMTSFKEMTAQLQQMEKLRAQLLASVTHELKTPVTSISGLAQAVHDRVVVGEEADEFLKYCIMECHRLKIMVDDLLDFNSFYANSLQVTRNSYSLKDAVSNIVELWEFSQEELATEVDLVDEDEAESWTVITDIERLKQIIINLLNNARDAIDPTGKITLRLTKSSEHYLIQVEDSGDGIPITEQSYIFEPFYRGQEKKTKVRGLGIGLPFSKLIAEALGGKLVLTSSSSEGTCFTLYLPR